MEKWDCLSLRLSLFNPCRRSTIALGALCRVRREAAISKDAGNASVIPISHISFDEGQIFTAKGDKKMPQFKAHPGDIVVSKIRARNGAIGVVAPGNIIGISANYRALVPHANAADGCFLWLALRSTFCRMQFLSATPGAAKGQIGEKQLLMIKIPHASFAEQKEIAALWRRRQAEHARTDADIAAREQSLGVGILAAAGIEFNIPPLRPRCFALQSAEMARWGVEFNRHRWRLDNLLRASKYPARPLSEVAFINPATRCKFSPQDEVTFVPMPAVSDKTGRIESPQTQSFNKVKSGYTRFAEGDVVWAKITPCMENGKCAVARGLQNGVGFGSTEFHVIRSRDPEIVLPEYLWLILRLPQLRRAATRYFIGSAGQQRVPEGFLSGLHMPVPPIAAQKKLTRDFIAARGEIIRARLSLENDRRKTAREIEDMILGGSVRD